MSPFCRSSRPCGSLKPAAAFFFLNASSAHPAVALAQDSPSVVRVACGRSHSLFLTAEGRVFGCGDNSKGQLGIDTDREPVLVPREVPIRPAKTVRRGGFLPLPMVPPRGRNRM